jgi:hypothetical protein
VSPTVLVWGDAGEVTAPGELTERIAAGGVIHVPVDLGCTDELTEVAGPIVAWTSPNRE